MAGVHAFSWYKARPSTGPMVRFYPETAGQTFTKGDPVKLDTAGRVLLAVETEGQNSTDGQDRGGFWGIAGADASGTTDALVKVVIATPEDLFAVSGSAAGATRTTIRTDVGQPVSWIKSTVSGETTKSVLNMSSVTDLNEHFLVVDLLDAVGVVDVRYLVKVNPVSWGVAIPVTVS